MKWNIIVGSLVLGLGLSTQSFGLDLLDRMLGVNYNGCCGKATCCETKCADPAPSCGCDAPCAVSCDPCAVRCRRTPILDLLRSHKCKKAACCDSGCADPACGCEAAADPGCGCEPACGAEPASCARRASPSVAVSRYWTSCASEFASPAAAKRAVRNRRAAVRPWWIRAAVVSRPVVPTSCASRSAAACRCSTGSSIAAARWRAATTAVRTPAVAASRAAVSNPLGRPATARRKRMTRSDRPQ